MTVYVDDWRQPARVGRIGGYWSHLVATTDAELHEFAASIGLRREWFQEFTKAGHLRRPHYDVTDAKRLQAIRAGAVAVSWRDLPQLRREGKVA
ncbi:DUF4031 domain-containing protein [Nonomuraea ceibae]|uniref:DUF4031 domain-containing protein n=1 Tax=Nonomuraea ceibae TaxID=1935170 RepID=UPI001C5E9BC6|nr:DUF4031 domain-containing protein [Nonomuraea ceibae]